MKMQNEADLWQFLRTEVFYGNADVHVSRIESHATSIGFPDLEYCYYGHCNTMEMKYSKDLESVTLRPSQYRWLTDRVNAGGRPLIFTCLRLNGDDTNIFLLHRGTQAKYLVAHNSWADWGNSAAKYWNPKEFDATELLSYMEKPWTL